MRLIIRPRRCGKTTTLIKLCAKNGGYIVCHSKEESIRIFQQANDMKRKIPLPISYDEFYRKQYYGRGVGKFHIDNAEMLLQYISDVPIESITMTKPSKKEVK